MPIQESSATALVRFTGLAMICTNEKEQQGEIAVLRDKQHSFTLSVKEARYEDGSNDIVRYVEVLSYPELPNENVRIEIKAQGEPVGSYQIYSNGNEKFKRQKSRDKNDFGWFVNLTDLHKSGNLTPTGTGPYSLSKVYIPDGVFYAHRLDEKLRFEKIKKNARGVADKPRAFGKVAKTLGVRLDGAEVTLTVFIGEKEEKHVFPRIPGLPRIIELNNINYDATNRVLSDMPDYYKYIACSNGDQFELSPVKEAAKDDGVIRGGAVNMEDFCHPVVLPLKSIDEL
jgi:hypothetical protein